MENELMIGSVSASLFLTIILGLIYRTFPKFPALAKPWLAIIIGVGFALLYMVYNDIAFAAKQVIDFAFNGFMIGATAVGLNELGLKKVIPSGKKQDPG